MKMLVWHGKHGPSYYDVSTETKKARVLKALFKEFDTEWGFYADIRPDEVGPREEETCARCKGTGKVKTEFYQERKLQDDLQRRYYAQAKQGDVRAIEQLLFMRDGYEYERVSYEEVR